MKEHVDKREGELKEKLAEKVRFILPHALFFLHQDIRNVGIPDATLTFAQRTSWWECKHGTPKFKSHGRQELTMLRLAKNGYHARYIVWHEESDGTNKRTLIVHPKNIGTLEFETSCLGFDAEFVVDYMRQVHQR